MKNDLLKKTNFFFNNLLQVNDFNFKDFQINFFLNILTFFVNFNKDYISDISGYGNKVLFKFQNSLINEKEIYFVFYFNVDKVTVEVSYGLPHSVDYSLNLSPMDSNICEDVICYLNNLCFYERSSFDLKKQSLLFDKFFKLGDSIHFILYILFARYSINLKHFAFFDFINGLDFLYHRSNISFLDRLLSSLYTDYEFNTDLVFFMNRKGILKNFLMRFCDNFDQDWTYIDLDTDDLISDILKALSIYDYSVLYSVGTNTNELCDVLDISLDLLRLSSKQILLLLDKKKNIREGDKNLVNFIKTLDNLFNKDDSIELLYQDLLMLDDLLFKLFDKKSIISNIKFLRLFINSLFKKIYSIKSLYKCYETVEDDFLIYLDKFVLNLTSVRLIKEDPEFFMVIMLNTNWKFDTDYMSISLDVLYSKDIFDSFLESLITKYIDNNLLIIFYVKLMFSLIYLENNVDRRFLGIIKSLLMKFSEINSIMIINNPGFRSKDISQKIMGYFLLFNGVNNSIDNIKLFGFNENLEIRDRLNLLGSSLWLSNEINTVTFTGTVCDMLAIK